ncbi:MAG: hypothetical protein DRP09_15010 [Candidatus Thorarchaeota archaeon]|nr:MAG: hypothetical protein DRP09_15010 [Candidatus Thorarchaeota archaeon]
MAFEDVLRMEADPPEFRPASFSVGYVVYKGFVGQVKDPPSCYFYKSGVLHSVSVSGVSLYDRGISEIEVYTSDEPLIEDSPFISEVSVPINRWGRAINEKYVAGLPTKIFALSTCPFDMGIRARKNIYSVLVDTDYNNLWIAVASSFGREEMKVRTWAMLRNGRANVNVSGEAFKIFMLAYNYGKFFVNGLAVTYKMTDKRNIHGNIPLLEATK